MILAAGLGTRLRPLTDLRAKPALPVLGRPVIGWLLAWLRAQGIREVAINLHHLPETVEQAARRSAPPDTELVFLREPRPLGTGGGMRGARDFLRHSDPSLVLAGDMVLDVDLAPLVAAHRRSGADCTLVLRDDPRAAQFGTIGLDDAGEVRRIGRRVDRGDETRAGVFVGLRILSPDAFDQMPEIDAAEPFEDLSDWLLPAAARGALRLRGELLDAGALVWEPVGTPAEYLAANLCPARVSFFSPTQSVAQDTKWIGPPSEVVLGSGARVGTGADLQRVVVWEDEQVPDNFRGAGGVFAGGRFYVCEALQQPQDEERFDE